MEDGAVAATVLVTVTAMKLATREIWIHPIQNLHNKFSSVNVNNMLFLFLLSTSFQQLDERTGYEWDGHLHKNIGNTVFYVMNGMDMIMVNGTNQGR